MELIPRYLIAEKLNITYLRKIENIIREYNLEPMKVDSHGIQYYKTEDFIALKNKQDDLYNYFRENFFTYQEALEKGLKHQKLLEIGFRELPELIRINDFYYNKNVYDKRFVQKEVEIVKRRKKLLNITQISKLLGVRYNFTNTILQEWGIEAKDERLSKYFDPEDVDFLLKKQVERYKYFTENYYTSKEIKALGMSYNGTHYKGIKGTKIDSIAKINKLKGLQVVYRKEEIDKYVIDIQNSEVEKDKQKEVRKKKQEYKCQHKYVHFRLFKNVQNHLFSCSK